jgi:hypothetical protein
VTLFGIVIDDNAEQPEKQKPPIEVTLFGTIKVFKFWQFSKQAHVKYVKASLMTNDSIG